MKSASNKVALYDPETGELLGYGEQIDMSKSAYPDGLDLGMGTNTTSNSSNDDDDEGNGVFDDLFFGIQPIGVGEVSKSARLDDDPTAEFESLFPSCLQTS